MNIYELYGRLAEQLAHEQAEHHRTVDLLRQVVAGELDAERVTVDAAGGWSIAPERPPAADAAAG